MNFYTPRVLRDDIKFKLSKIVLELIQKTSKDNKNRLLVLKKYLAKWSKSEEMLDFLLPYIKSHNDQELGYIGLENGWTILVNIFAYYKKLSMEEKWKLFDIWEKHDGSD